MRYIQLARTHSSLRISKVGLFDGQKVGVGTSEFQGQHSWVQKSWYIYMQYDLMYVSTFILTFF